MQIRILFRFNHGTITIFEMREREGRMCVWNQVDAAPSSRKFVSIGTVYFQATKGRELSQRTITVFQNSVA